jgi:hemoglobin
LFQDTCSKAPERSIALWWWLATSPVLWSAMTFLVAVSSLRVLLGPIQPIPARRESPAISSGSPLGGHLPRRMLETIQATGERFGIVTRVARQLQHRDRVAGVQGREDVMAEPTLYERLGGIFAIAAVVDHFSDQLLKNPKVVEANPELNEWHTAKYPGRLPGLKFLRTLWVASLAGGPFQYTARELRDAHFDLKIAPEVFDEVAAELGRTLDHFSVPGREREEVLAAFNGWKEEVTAGSQPGAINWRRWR